ncbi:hypothetical protein [Corallococcus exiguus]|uniref:hypothetical protein n=1 Tax=Corallococcus exiguus TaxID=83462 RepID=UPI003DA3BC75
MKCFKVVQQVLDATYDEIPNKSDKRDNEISNALKSMSDQYLNNLTTSGGPDFDDPVTRFAYVYNYVPSHAHWLYELIDWSDDAKEVFTKPKIRLTCLGGGPGSDLVGILKYISQQDKQPMLFCEIIDGCIHWKQTWSDLAFNLGWKNTLHTDYSIQDVDDKKSWLTPTGISKSDIITISFFASEIFHLGEKATKYLEHVFDKAKSGAIILVNDNNSPRFHKWIDKIAKDSKLDTLLAEAGTRKIYDRDESTLLVGQYKEKFKRNPRLQGNLFWRVFKKP